MSSGAVGRLRIGGLVLVLLMGVPGTDANGQQPAAARPSPREDVAVDLTGHWVSVITEDWRFRMVTPPPRDYASVPLNAEGRRLADRWTIDQAADCKVYGVGGIMRVPGRLRISWEDDATLRIDTDAGRQTRRLYFDPLRPAPRDRSLQGFSRAEWSRAPDALDILRTGGFDGLGSATRATPPKKWLPLKVTTTNILPAWLRANGVPYSEKAVITEYFMRFDVPGDGDWFTVMTVVDDPAYLTQPFITSSNFRRERDEQAWYPRECGTAAAARATVAR
jgi:hypothetical protein